MPSLPPDFAAHAEAIVAEASAIEGHLQPREARLLALLGACPTAAGAVLEIGSFKGRSTVILCKSAALAGDARIHAIDPLTSPSVTDPHRRDGGAAGSDFRVNLLRAGVADRVDFHQALAHDVARAWTEPLRLLWIDGDHTHSGALSDFCDFAPYLADGAIVAFHDVLNAFEGPVRVFAEEVLLSPRFGAAGLCGSIAWAQRVMSPRRTEHHARHKLTLYRRLTRLIPDVAFGRTPSGLAKARYKLLRCLVPHGELPPQEVLDRLGSGPA